MTPYTSLRAERMRSAAISILSSEACPRPNLSACHLYAHPNPEGHSNFGQDFLDGFLERLLLFFGNLISGSYQPGYDIGCLEVQVNSLRLLFQKFPELYSEKGNLLIDSFDMGSFLQFQLFCLIQSPAIETPWATLSLAFSVCCHNSSGIPKNSANSWGMSSGVPENPENFWVFLPRL